ncbi:MAG: hypothetical protein FWD15_00600 [Alphaproteobacteria bacterium]|nr:hypothetical protein [Alphaproteobacteria bacterium]
MLFDVKTKFSWGGGVKLFFIAFLALSVMGEDLAAQQRHRKAGGTTARGSANRKEQGRQPRATTTNTGGTSRAAERIQTLESEVAELKKQLEALLGTSTTEGEARAASTTSLDSRIGALETWRTTLATTTGTSVNAAQFASVQADVSKLKTDVAGLDNRYLRKPSGWDDPMLEDFANRGIEIKKHANAAFATKASVGESAASTQRVNEFMQEQEEAQRHAQAALDTWVVYGPLRHSTHTPGSAMICQEQNLGVDDPIRNSQNDGKRKICFTRHGEHIATQGEAFTVPADGFVLYGQSLRKRGFARHSTISCDDATFGDPARGRGDRCYVNGVHITDGGHTFVFNP